MGAFDDLIPQSAGAFDDLIPKKSKPGMLEDIAKSLPTGMVSGLVNATSGPVIPESPVPQPPEISGGNAPAVMGVVQDKLTGPLYQPQTNAGKYGLAAGEALGNPLSYVGPGGLPLKVGASVLGALGSEAGGQAAQGTKYETPARLGGALAGGVAGVKALGPAAERAAVPTAAELSARADAGYTAARNSGVEIAPEKLADAATKWQQDLTTGPKYAFTGGQDGTAPKTLGLLDKLQNPPEGSTVTAANLDTLRRQINNIAGETEGFKPTADAKAAMVLKRQFGDYLENPPQDHVVAGNAEDFVNNIKQANGDYAAMSRANAVDSKVARAETNTAGSIAASADNQIKSQLRSILNNPKAQRGYTPDEIAQMSAVNSGSLASNTLRQLGRGGTGVIPMATHIGTALATGGSSIPASLGIGLPLYGAKKLAEALTRRQANNLSETLRMRSPEFAARQSETNVKNLLANQSRIPANKAAILRALLNTQ
jgi:hypothetical protein